MPDVGIVILLFFEDSDKCFLLPALRSPPHDFYKQLFEGPTSSRGENAGPANPLFNGGNSLTSTNCNLIMLLYIYPYLKKVKAFVPVAEMLAITSNMYLSEYKIPETHSPEPLTHNC